MAISYAVFDTETGGLDPTKNPLIELYLVLLDENLNHIAEGGFKLAFDEKDCDPQALKVNGINPKTWKPSHATNKIALERMRDFLKKFADDKEKIAAVGYNIDFDLNFLEAAYKKEGVPFDLFNRRFKLDLMQFSELWRLVTGVDLKYRTLKYALKAFNVDGVNDHTAKGDTYATVNLLKTYINQFKSKKGINPTI